MYNQSDPTLSGYQAVASRIIAKMKAKGTTKPCVLCGVNSWIVGQYVTLNVSPRPGGAATPWGQIGPSKTYPTVCVFCGNCGNTQLLNLLVLGFEEHELSELQLPPT